VAQESSATVALSDLWNFDPQEKMLATPMPVRPARSRNVQVIRGLEVIEERVSSKGDTTLAAVTAD